MEATDGLCQSVLRAHGHPVDMQCLFDFLIRHDIILCQLTQTLAVERQMQAIADLRGYCHQSTAKGQDASLAPHCLTGDGHELIGGEGFVVGKVVNARGHIFVEQTTNDITYVGDGGKRPAVFKSTQRPGQAFGKHLAQEVEIAFVSFTGVGTTSSVSTSPCTRSAAAFTEEKKIKVRIDGCAK